MRGNGGRSCGAVLFSLAQRPRHGGQIGIDLRRFREISFRVRLFALAGEHQDRLGTRSRRGLQIAKAVAHRRNALKRNVESLGDGVKHSRVGLAARRIRVGRIRAVEDRIDASAGLRHGLVHAGMDGVQGGHVEQPPAHARLIGGDDHPVAGLSEFGDRVEAPRDRSPFVRALYELVAVEIDDPVPVENGEFHWTTKP